MSKIVRATQKIFAQDAPTNQITTFGTAMTDSPNNSRDLADIQNANFLNGWASAIQADKAPYEEDTNGLCYAITSQLAYLFQQGIPEWDAGTTYYTNSIVQVIQDNILVLKRSLTDDNTGNNPLTDTVNWTDYFSQRVIHTIGEPIISLNSTLEDNEIWLEGATVSRTTYSNLFAIYGTAYGAGDGSTTFKLPDFRNRAIWGANSFGYLSAGLPNIVGLVQHVTSRTAINNIVASGCFTSTYTGEAGYDGGRHKISDNNIELKASRNSSIYGASSTVQPPAIKVRVKTRYQ